MIRTLATKLGVLGAAVALLPVTAAAAEPPDRLGWGPCPGGEPGVQCASLRVPMDWAKPDGRTLTLMLGRLEPSGTAEGSVLVGFGGPTGNYIQFLREYAAPSFAGLRQRMNVVTWDIRGGPGLPGLSRPVLDCEYRTRRVPDYPAGGAAYRELVAGNRSLARECRQRDPELFDNMDSASNARDMEAIRAALGEPRLNFYGSSYAGLFGQAYARLFPHRVRTMVLDGTINHSAANWWRELAALAMDNERSMRRFFDWCAADASCALHGTDVAARWRRLTARADREPVPAPSVDASYGGNDLRSLGLAAARAGGERWAALGTAIADAERGDASGFATPGARVPYPAVPVPGVVECLDLPRAGGFGRLIALRGLLRRIAPHVGAASPIPRNLLTCEGWPAPVTNPPEPLPGTLPPLLGAGYWNESDAVGRAVRQVPGSGSVRHEGPGHVLYFGNECARRHIDRYLTERVVPAWGTRC